MALSVTRSLPVGPNTVGPVPWRDSTMRGIKDNNKVICRSDETVKFGRSVDPLPHLRDILAGLSNNEALRYGRQVRLIVHRLRAEIIDVNEEMKALNRVREAIERLHEHMRKDIKTNTRCQSTRLTRPPREKCRDAADDHLSAELIYLDNLKKMLESHLNLVKIQLQTLNAARARLTAVHQERSRDGRIAREHSVTLRQEAKILLKRAEDIQKTAHDTVNRSVTQKMAETDNLKIHLDIAIEENRTAKNRAQRYFDKTSTAYFLTQGPESSHDLLTLEKLTRPMISTLQRHPGNTMPETQELVRAGDGLKKALNVTGRNLGILKMTEQELRDDRQDKVTAFNLDNSVLKLRKRRGKHRWVMGGVVEHSWF